MAITNFPNGVSSFGIPLLGSGGGIPVTTGTYFFVDSNTGLSTNAGVDPDYPLATIDQAIGKCTASKFDVIVVMPGHAETISGATSLVADVAGVQIIGLGRGSLRPTLTFSATASIISVTAANVTLENLVLVGAVDNIVTGISAAATADGLTLRDIEMRDGAADKEFLIGIAIAAACTDVTIDGLLYRGFAGGGATGCIEAAGAADRFTMRNCYINGDFSSQAVDLSQAASVDVQVLGNRVINIDTTAGLGIALHAATTGFVANNYVANLKDTVAGISGAGAAYCENYCSNALGAQGLLVPGADS